MASHCVPTYSCDASEDRPYSVDSWIVGTNSDQAVMAFRMAESAYRTDALLLVLQRDSAKALTVVTGRGVAEIRDAAGVPAMHEWTWPSIFKELLWTCVEPAINELYPGYAVKAFQPKAAPGGGGAPRVSPVCDMIVEQYLAFMRRDLTWFNAFCDEMTTKRFHDAPRDMRRR
jgi:hypothetical protein